VGLLTTALAYAVFVGLIAIGIGYIFASVAGWAAPMTVSYLLNRRFTFNISGIAGPPTEMATFVIGSLLQLTLSLADYSLLMGALSLAPTPAFIINTALMAAFSFLFMRWVTFRAKLDSRASLASEPPS
jgi:putative flippase GtrA